MISSANTADYVADKIEQFLKDGALKVCVVYPNRKQLWVYAPGGTCAIHSGVFTSALLGEATINLDKIPT